MDELEITLEEDPKPIDPENEGACGPEESDEPYCDKEMKTDIEDGRLWVRTRIENTRRYFRTGGKLREELLKRYVTLSDDREALHREITRIEYTLHEIERELRWLEQMLATDPVE